LVIWQTTSQGGGEGFHHYKGHSEMNTQPITQSVGKRLFKLMEDYTVYFYHRNDYYRLKIKKGFIYDGASIPRWAWSILGKTPIGTHDSGTIFHDLVYMLKKNHEQTAIIGQSIDQCTHVLEMLEGDTWHKVIQGMTRDECDRIMFEIIDNTYNAKLSKFQRAAMFNAIRIGGGRYWKRHTPNQVINPSNCG
jgi:hypothetical protein